MSVECSLRQINILQLPCAATPSNHYEMGALMQIVPDSAPEKKAEDGANDSEEAPLNVLYPARKTT